LCADNSSRDSSDTISDMNYSLTMNITGDDLPERFTGNETTDLIENQTVVLDRFCDRDPPEWLRHYSEWQPIADFVVGYIVPMTIIFALYGITARTLVNSGTLERRASKDRHQQDREHAARRVYIV